MSFLLSLGKTESLKISINNQKPKKPPQIVPLVKPIKQLRNLFFLILTQVWGGEYYITKWVLSQKANLV